MYYIEKYFESEAFEPEVELLQKTTLGTQAIKFNFYTFVLTHTQCISIYTHRYPNKMKATKTITPEVDNNTYFQSADMITAALLC